MKIEKLAVAILVSVFLFNAAGIAMPNHAYAAQAELSGKETKSNTYHINTVEDLKSIRMCTTIGKYFVLEKDIDLSHENWEPITQFGGTFDGNGFKITNCNNSLFDNIALGGFIKNIFLENVSINISSLNAGALGGLARYNYGHIEQCYVTGNISGSNFGSVGGIVGYNYGTLKQCYSTGIVSESEGGSHIGGLAGDNDNGRISDSYSRANISVNHGDWHCIGGLVGFNNGAVINCYSSGRLSSTAVHNSIGGLTGFTHSESLITCCYYDSTTYGSSTCSNKVDSGKNTADMYKKATYFKWNFSDTWEIIDGADYPHLQFETLILKSFTFSGDAETDNLKLLIEFQKNVQLGSGSITINSGDNSCEIADTINADSAHVVISGNTAVIKPNVKLKCNGNYYVLMDNQCFKDNNNRFFAGISDPNVWKFKTRQASSDAALKSLILKTNDDSKSDIAVIQAAGDPNYYTASVVSGVNSITVTPTANEGHATLTVNGKYLSNGQPSSISFVPEKNTMDIIIKVTAEDGITFLVYTVQVSRPVILKNSCIIQPDKPLTQVNLNGSKVTATLINDEFKSNNASVNINDFILNNLPAGITISKVDPVTTASAIIYLAYDGTCFYEDINDFTLTIKGASVKSGSTVTSDSIIIKAVSRDTALSNLELNGTQITNFSPKVFSYSVSVDNSVNSIKLVPTASSTKAGIMISSQDGNIGVKSGEDVLIKGLAEGPNIIKIILTAEDSAYTDTYVIEVFRQKAVEIPKNHSSTEENYSSIEAFNRNKYEFRRLSSMFDIASELNTGDCDNIVISTGMTFADSLTGTLLAARKNAPILFTDIKSDEDVLSYVGAHLKKSGTLYILGREGAVNLKIESRFKKLGFNIVRLGGTDRYDTCEIINNNLDIPKEVPVIIASGENFPDALSISSVAAIKGYPILLTQKDIVPNQTIRQLNRIKPSKIYVIGGTEVISEDTFNMMKKCSSNVNRIYGIDRYETSLNICKAFNFNSNGIITLSIGSDFKDALAGSVISSKYGAPILLVGDNITHSAKQFLDDSSYRKLIIFGDTDSINKDIVNTLTR